MPHPSLHLAAGSALDATAHELVLAAAAAGFDGVGLRLSHDHRLDHGLDSVGLREVGMLLRAHGLVLHDAEVHRIAESTPDPASLLDAAAALGARHLLVVSDLADDARTIDELGALAARCRAAGIVPALEYMRWTNPNTSADAIRMAVAADTVIVVDLLHHHRLGEGADELRAVVASGRLGWVQLCDAPGPAPAAGMPALIDEARHRRLAPGEGGLPIAEFLRAVPDGTAVSVEVQSDALLGTPVHERAARLHRAATAVLSGPSRGAHDPSNTG